MKTSCADENNGLGDLDCGKTDQTNNGECNDGGPGSQHSDCLFGLGESSQLALEPQSTGCCKPDGAPPQFESLQTVQTAAFV